MKRLKEVRLSKGLKQENISNDLQITQAAYSHYENGRRNPDPATLKKLAEYFNISADYLLEIIDVPLTPAENEIRRNPDKYTEIKNGKYMFGDQELTEEQTLLIITLIKSFKK